MAMTTATQNDAAEIPCGNLDGFKRNFKHDIVSGFLVFLIALPLCLAISLACGYPAIAGVFTAVIGSILTSFISNSEMTIKGPAAGLIVIVLGAMQAFGYTAGKDPAADLMAYKMALGVGVAAGVLQIVFALLRTGVLGGFFPTSVVHGMLAAIGVIIISKQLPVTMGLGSTGAPLELLARIPDNFMHMNPAIAMIGGISLLILFGLPLIKNRYARIVPAQMLVVLVTVPLGMYLDLEHEHTYTFNAHTFPLDPSLLVAVPNNMFSAITFPDFSGLKTAVGWQWVIMFALIGTLESMLSAKAIDLIDPWRRKTNLDRDNLAVGVCNTLAACVGGLPMISEIVRSKANIDNGARTRFSDMFHGIFLLSFVALVPGLIHEIPRAALGAMLVYTGFRLASPKEFISVYKVGREQLVIFLVTIFAVLATDLLVGIGIGIAVKFGIHLLNGAPLTSLFKPPMEVAERDDGTIVVTVEHAAIFSSWISLRKQLELLSQGTHEIEVNLSGARLVDHTVMENLHELETEFHSRGCHLVVTGLDNHHSFSTHPFAARKRLAV